MVIPTIIVHFVIGLNIIVINQKKQKSSGKNCTMAYLTSIKSKLQNNGI